MILDDDYLSDDDDKRIRRLVWMGRKVDPKLVGRLLDDRDAWAQRAWALAEKERRQRNGAPARGWLPDKDHDV